MLQALHIENIAVIERADMEPERGLNVLTGETGAGKSIVIDALGAVLGARVSKDMVRSGAEHAAVTAQFTADGAEEWCASYGVEPEDGCIFISRKIAADGKSACRVNGAPVPASALRELGACLLDIHGQTDGQRMADERYHLAYLDGFGRLAGEKAAYLEKYAAYISVKKELDAVTTDEGEREKRLDTLGYQIDELERASLRDGESETLEARRGLLKNAARITDAVETAYASLYGGGDTDGLLPLASEAEGELRSASRWAAELEGLAARLETLRIEAEDIAETLRDFRGGLDFSPRELEDIEARLDLLRRLSRKYGPNEKAMLEYLEGARAERESLERSDERREELERELQKRLAEARRAAEGLSEKRRAAAAELQKRITAELRSLSMPNVGFEAEISPAELSKTGADGVRFLMSANAGERPGRISRIASGGELSRIMLAMKTVLSEGDDIGAMVFDEIDTGVSGIAASRVGEKLAALAREKQIICVTHLPQIAAMADAHFDIAKSAEGGRTYTRITRLDRAGRRSEIARLTGGDSVTDTVLRAAEEMLASADAFKGRKSDG